MSAQIKKKAIQMSRKPPQRKFKVYNSLRMTLSRSKIALPGKVATLLLEVFLEQNGFLKADMAVERGLCKKGEFSLWRDELQKKGFIFFQYEGPGTSHRPGSRLNEYLNKEKLANREIVVREDLNAFPKKDEVPSRQEFEEMKERMAALERAMQKEIEKNDPPFTMEKLQARLEIVKH